ncbi:threonine-phosphate decarboxylase CobD [Endobacterium cereale]|uniref:threonine-phosphate decarboxylase CobD n=1 Tax=Endobacterium cereale TaxID=2663029 RepID=UPI002B476DBD|nr:threonine-phosphate decarboxylase CobD [Endobacterium cereale]MEB2847526.1 threonine-phosphate decarboxylase CobD [Endobacterium cereale]
MQQDVELVKDTKIDHGGNLAGASTRFPNAPKPWIDLSTGINPHAYPHSDIASTAFCRLPEPSALHLLKCEAAAVYGAPSSKEVAAAPGTQILLPLLVECAFGGSIPPGAKAAILSPTYAEHAHMARLAGFDLTETAQFEELFAADLALVVNPNNPDGRLIDRADLLRLATHMAAKGGLLVVDEAFMDVMPPEHSVAGDIGPSLAVLRSFGKFYGLAGLRLGFALAPAADVRRIEARLGPWAVSGPALQIATQALADRDWQSDMRKTLPADLRRLDDLLTTAGLDIVGGTSLFRLIRHSNASALYEQFGEAGILVRSFNERPKDLRFGLPSGEGWERLTNLLASKPYQQLAAAER